ncbi:uncharacterized protein LOC116301124 [Actinia tenebrosa]|uniref:Uncharacterized protein LOC116301124 n=1 Tax=Actinia tenebrosa TaxID=6105 RepID=A0A6P8IH70_ACTTE|nr:uncharacterized protein LOC116301124 [Actinia tenebrosa]
MDAIRINGGQIIIYGLSFLSLILVNNVMTLVLFSYLGCSFVPMAIVLVIYGFLLLCWSKYSRKSKTTSETKPDRKFLMDALRSVETSKIPYVVDRFLELDKAGETTEEQEERISRIPLDSCCVVCLSSEACIRTLPCSHTVTCGWCAWQSLKISFENGTPHRCVICRTEIEDFTGSLIKNLMNIKWKDVRKIVDEIKE